MIYDWNDQEEVDFAFFSLIHENFYEKNEGDILPRLPWWKRLIAAMGHGMVQYGSAYHG